MWLHFNFLFRAVKLNLWFSFSAHNVMFTHQACQVDQPDANSRVACVSLLSSVALKQLHWPGNNMLTLSEPVWKIKNKCWMNTTDSRFDASHDVSPSSL